MYQKNVHGDFILELEVLVAPGLNSGIQFRSNSIKEYRWPCTWISESELDTSKRAWSAGIYDEGRRVGCIRLPSTPRGVLPLTMGLEQGKDEAIGNSIKAFMNGVQCANLVDDMTAQGFIALQVHSIRDKAQEGKTIQWKNIKNLTENLEQYRTKNQPHVRQIG